ncbi:hypothetical protein [Thiosulfatihalobacter marinus]|uniref:hypothetical protein n=1 Tax=Thiosulfatihalobacter marinus TaxID=2792481 RepID=UPI0018D9CE57|nr:hypothetical protein [Thiosulfatihalobacter marinus]
MSSIEEVWARMEARAERQAEEAARLDAVRGMGFVPRDVGPDIPQAPARGPVRMFEGRSMVQTDTGGFVRQRTGHMGRKTLQRADSFDLMSERARAAHTRAVRRAEQEGKNKPVFQEPFTPAQVAMGRFYRDLVEKHESAGVKCSSLESLSQRSAGSGSDFMDAVLRDRERIGVLRKRIGSGSAMVVRRIRPSGRGSRVTIMDRRLVDIVCLEDGTITDVLRTHGWVRSGEGAQAKHIAALRIALGEALDRMIGPARAGGISVARFDK